MRTYDEMLDELRKNEDSDTWERIKTTDPVKREKIKDYVIGEMRKDAVKRKEFEEREAAHQAKVKAMADDIAADYKKLDSMEKEIESLGGKLPERKEQTDALTLSFDKTKRWVGMDDKRNGKHRIEGFGEYIKTEKNLNCTLPESESQEKKEAVVECMILHLKRLGVTEADATGRKDLVEIAKAMMKKHGISVKGEAKPVENIVLESAPRLA